jgi:GNAT superfamily N-acetyltransferase
VRISCKTMSAASADDAFFLLNSFLRNDRHYLSNSRSYGDRGPAALKRAIKLFLRRPEFGFVWLAYEKSKPVGVCVVCYAISTLIGGLVAKLDDVFVIQEKQREGVATQMMNALKRKLRKRRILRIDTSVYKRNRAADRYYQDLKFRPLGEERLSLVL